MDTHDIRYSRRGPWRGIFPFPMTMVESLAMISVMVGGALLLWPVAGWAAELLPPSPLRLLPYVPVVAVVLAGASFAVRFVGRLGACPACGEVHRAGGA